MKISRLGGCIGGLALWAGCQAGAGDGEQTLQRLLAANGASGLPALVSPGQPVEARLALGPDGRVVARKLKIEPARGGAAEAKLAGVVTEIDAAAGTFTVLGVRVAVSPTTTFKDLPGDGTLAGVKVGERLKVKLAPPQPGAPLVATKVRALPPRLEGPLEAVSDTELRVLGVAIATTPETVVKIKGAEKGED
jgi:hypothetical protein